MRKYRVYIFGFATLVFSLCLLLGFILWTASKDKKPLFRLPHDGEITSIAFSPDGRSLATSIQGKDCDLFIWNAQNGEPVKHFTGCPNREEEAICRVSYSPDGKYIAIIQCNNQSMWFLDAETGKSLQQFTVPNKTHFATFNTDGNLLLTLDSAVRIWDVRTNREIVQFGGYETGIFDAAFSPDGQLIATANGDETARIWDAVSGNELLRFVGHNSVVNDVEFSIDGEMLLTASNDGTVRQWNAKTGEEIHRFNIPGKWIRKAFYNPSTRQIIAIGLYSDVWVFDADSQKESTHFSPAPGTWLITAAISPDKSTFALAYNNVVTVWSTKK